jgi:hypothetical protein
MSFNKKQWESVAIVVIVALVGIVVVMVADYDINSNIVYTVNGLGCFRTDRFHSGDNRMLKQTAACFLKCIDTTNRMSRLRNN